MKTHLEKSSAGFFPVAPKSYEFSGSVVKKELKLTSCFPSCDLLEVKETFLYGSQNENKHQPGAYMKSGQDKEEGGGK